MSLLLSSSSSPWSASVQKWLKSNDVECHSTFSRFKRFFLVFFASRTLSLCYITTSTTTATSWTLVTTTMVATFVSLWWLLSGRTKISSLLLSPGNCWYSLFSRNLRRFNPGQPLEFLGQAVSTFFRLARRIWQSDLTHCSKFQQKGKFILISFEVEVVFFSDRVFELNQILVARRLVRANLFLT